MAAIGFRRTRRLQDYRSRRDFSATPEPAPRRRVTKPGKRFVVQKHRASHLHYDFRLEVDGVLKSWAVPKGPSLDPSVKRFAVMVEDHPIEYAGFEGVIPEGEYGAGTVMVWDRGTFIPEETSDPGAALEDGELKFTLKGKKLKGSWVLVRTRLPKHGHEPRESWMLIKRRDEYASTTDITESASRSVVSRRTLRQIAADEGGDVERAATGDV